MLSLRKLSQNGGHLHRFAVSQRYFKSATKAKKPKVLKPATTCQVGRLRVRMVPALTDNYIFIIEHMKNGHVVVVDPGDADAALAALDGVKKDQMDAILLTHHHPDHINGVREITERFDTKVIGHGKRIPNLDSNVQVPSTLMLPYFQHSIEVINTPGHTHDHVSYHWTMRHGETSPGLLFCGDSLFAMGSGRVIDGTNNEAWDTLNELMKLPDDTRVFCGHEYTEENSVFARWIDPNNSKMMQRFNEVEKLHSKGLPTIPTTIGLEKETNPFVRGPRNEDIRKRVGLSDPDMPPSTAFARIRKMKDEF